MATSRYRFLALPAAILMLSPVLVGCGRHAAPNAVRSETDSRVSRQTADDLARHFAATQSKGGVPLSRAAESSLQSLALGRTVPPRGAQVFRAQDEIGFSWSLSVRFFDADGHEQVTLIPGLTASMSIVARAHGSMVSAREQASVGVYRALDVDGLLPAESTLDVNGAAHDTSDCAFAAVDTVPARAYHLLADGTVTDVRTLKDTSANPYPLSGTLRWQVQADATQGAQHARYRATVVVTFNGTRYPTIEVDEHFDYTFDLETGEITRTPA